MKRMLFLLLSINAIAWSPAFAAVSDEDLEQLRQQLTAVSQRLEELAAENAELRRSQAQTATAVADVQKSVSEAPEMDGFLIPESWSERVKLDGDFRYRYETIDVEGKSNRSRSRIRARTNIRATLADDVEVGFGLATGGDEPTSTNQTLGSGGSSKSIILNLAYADWRVTEGLHLIGGKFKNPLVRVGKQSLIWDGDWTPEGLAVTYKRDRFFLNGIATFLESDSRTGNDALSWGAQFGATGEIGGAKVKGGVGYYSIKTKGDRTSFGDPSEPSDYLGNTAIEPGGLPCGSSPGTSCAYLYDYLLTEVFAEASFDLGSWPTLVFFDLVNNGDSSDNDTGWTAGTRIGQTKDRGQLQLSYFYADKEADSVIGLLTDSDFGGGGTDTKGHFLQLNVGVNKNWAIGAQYFINEFDISSGAKSDYNRLTLDAQWKWK